MSKSIKAEVAINTFFSKLKAAMVRPRMAPPVPNNPAEKPDKLPPTIAFFRLGLITRSFFSKNNNDKCR